MKSISEKVSKRVCDHMNKDHKDSIYKYLNHYKNIHIDVILGRELKTMKVILIMTGNY